MITKVTSVIDPSSKEYAAAVADTTVLRLQEVKNGTAKFTRLRDFFQNRKTIRG